jgi:hypothetical protein
VTVFVQLVTKIVTITVHRKFSIYKQLILLLKIFGMRIAIYKHHSIEQDAGEKV